MTGALLTWEVSWNLDTAQEEVEGWRPVSAWDPASARPKKLSSHSQTSTLPPPPHSLPQLGQEVGQSISPACHSSLFTSAILSLKTSPLEKIFSSWKYVQLLHQRQFKGTGNSRKISESRIELPGEINLSWFSLFQAAQ